MQIYKQARDFILHMHTFTILDKLFLLITSIIIN